MSLCSVRYHIIRLNTSAEKLVKKLFGEKEVEAVLQRLDRLTQDEARITAAQTLEVVYGLVQNMRVVMDSKQVHWVYCLVLSILPIRWQSLGRPCPGCARYVLLATMKPLASV